MNPVNISRSLWIDGWMTPKELLWLAIRAQSAQVIVEVGCFLGRTTRALAEHTAGVVYAVDPWRDPWVPEHPTDPLVVSFAESHAKTFEEFNRNIADLSNVFIYRGTMEGLPPVAPDMVFIDGDHHYGAVVSDIENAKRQLARGRKPGLLCGHDYGCSDWPEVTQAVDDTVGPGVSVSGSIWWKNLA